MNYPKALLAVVLLGFVTANTAFAENGREFDDQTYTTEDTRRGEQKIFAQSRSVTTDALSEDRRDERSPEWPGRDIEENLPGR